MGFCNVGCDTALTGGNTTVPPLQTDGGARSAGSRDLLEKMRQRQNSLAFARVLVKSWAIARRRGGKGAGTHASPPKNCSRENPPSLKTPPRPPRQDSLHSLSLWADPSTFSSCVVVPGRIEKLRVTDPVAVFDTPIDSLYLFTVF
jgi:hypothetical protein